MKLYYGHRVTDNPINFPLSPDTNGNVISSAAMDTFLASRTDWKPITPETLSTDEGAALTFDDGYHDNLTTLLPLLEKHNAPATIFVTTNFIDRTQLPMEYCLTAALEHSDTFTLPGGKTVALATLDEKRSWYDTTRKALKKLKAKRQQRYLEQFNVINNVNITAIHNLFLSWDEVRTLSKHPLITIGSHGCGHAPLTSFHTYHEMKASRKLLQKELGCPITLAAYPYGVGSNLVHRITRQCGYEAIFTTSQPSDLSFVHTREKLP